VQDSGVLRQLALTAFLVGDHKHASACGQQLLAAARMHVASRAGHPSEPHLSHHDSLPAHAPTHPEWGCLGRQPEGASQSDIAWLLALLLSAQPHRGSGHGGRASNGLLLQQL
jgi:hypothetical protein